MPPLAVYIFLILYLYYKLTFEINNLFHRKFIKSCDISSAGLSSKKRSAFRACREEREDMRYLDSNSYYRQRFGHRMYKAALSLDVTCPNRDGSCGSEGCAFCSAGGSGEFASPADLTISESLDMAIGKLSAKTGSDTGFIAYFQSFTSTYCEPDYLRRALLEASAHEKVEAIAVGTRPDCLPDEILDVLSDVNRILPVFVELGLQTSNDKTAEWFGRGYRTGVFDEAVNKLKERGLNTTAHVIFYLKGETREDMLGSVRHVVESGCDGIKITCLYILKGTRVADEWQRGELALPTMEEYFDTIERALEIIPRDMVVHRITGDGPKSLLLAPMWTADKRAVVNYINRRFG